jgi:CHAT domain-containing protein
MEVTLGTNAHETVGTLINLGIVCSNMGKFNLALEYYFKASEIIYLKKGDENIEYALCLYNIGNDFLNLDNFEKAEKNLFKSLEIYKKIKGDKDLDYAQTMYAIGILYLKKRDYKSSLNYYEKAKDIFEYTIGEMHPLYAKTLSTLGSIYNIIGDMDISESYLLKSTNILKITLGEFHPDYIMGMINLGDFYCEHKNFKNAESCFDLDLNYLSKIWSTNSYYYAKIINSIGLFHWHTGNFDKAEELLKSSYEIIKNNYNEQHYAYLSFLVNLGSFYSEIGNYTYSEKYLKHGLEIANKNEMLGSTYIILLQSLGVLNMNIGNYNISEIYLKESVELAKKTHGINSIKTAECLHNLATLYLESGQLNAAENLLKEAIDIKKKTIGVEHPDYASTLNNLANFNSEIGQLDTAENLLKEAIDIMKKTIGVEHPDYILSLISLGCVHSDNKKILEANAAYKDALTILKKTSYSEAENYSNLFQNLAFNFLELGEFDSAKAYMNIAYTKRNNHLKNNFQFLSSEEKLAYWNKEKWQYLKFNFFSLKTYESLKSIAELSYNVNITTKSLLSETSLEFKKAIAESNNLELNEQFNKMKYCFGTYYKMQSEGSNNFELMENYKNQADSLDKILVNSLGEYAAAKQKFEISWKDVQNSISSEEAAIEFAQYYDVKDSLFKYMALVLRPGYEYPKLIKLGTEKEIQKAVNNKDFQSLYSLVWEGLDSLLDGVKTVYYSPSGELNNVAFSALCYQSLDTTQKFSESKNTAQRSTKVVIESEDGQSCSNYLIDKYNLHQLSSTRYLADGTLNKDKAMNLSIQLLGAINYDAIPEQKNLEEKEQTNEDFVLEINLNKQIERGKNKKDRDIDRKMAYLPGTKAEVNNVSKLLKNNNWKVTVKTEKDAGEYELKKNLIASNPGVLHIATHGFAFPDEEQKVNYQIEPRRKSNYKISDNPMVRCGLMLSGSNISWTGNPQKMIAETGDDGILTAAEVSNLNLSKTKLVVLSACQTGLGKIEGSEGTFGLKRGFKLAGVEQLIVSLWSVPDKETMELMTTFYDDLTKTKNPVISFEKAQKEMRQKYPTEPLKWAGFVLVR